jgi:D-alanine-D-alanine ligase-like ATP-grasp enzyme
MGLVTEQIRRLAYRAQFYLDVPSLIQLLKFRQLRRLHYQDLWRQAARNIGADFSDWDFGYARISRDGRTTMVKQSSVMLDDHLTLDLMGNKALVYSLMAELGFSVPEHKRFTMANFADCAAFFRALERPVVVKPTSGTGGGRGVTTGITNLRALRKAARLAASFDDQLLVEEQLDGHSFRLLYLDGEIIDAVRRDPPVVTGDGRRTIRQLVKIENKRRLRGDPVTALSPLKIDRDCQNKLQELGLRPGSRLEAGKTIELKRAINENDREKNHNVLAQVHRETIAAGARLVQALGVSFAGLDVICKDISSALGTSNGLISEINTTPGLHHHYLVSNTGNRVPVAELVLEHMFRSGHGVMELDVNIRRLKELGKHSNRAEAAVA